MWYPCKQTKSKFPGLTHNAQDDLPDRLHKLLSPATPTDPSLWPLSLSYRVALSPPQGICICQPCTTQCSVLISAQRLEESFISTEPEALFPSPCPRPSLPTVFINSVIVVIKPKNVYSFALYHLLLKQYCRLYGRETYSLSDTACLQPLGGRQLDNE